MYSYSFKLITISGKR